MVAQGKDLVRMGDPEALIDPPRRILMLFVDGLGWGEPDPARNPCHSYGGQLLSLPAVEDGAARRLAQGAWARPIDAVLGVPGVPQSATGQTTMLSGVNAQERLGKHLTGYPNDALRAILREHSLLKEVVRRGGKAAFLNAYRPIFFTLSKERQWRLSATTVANLAAELPFFRLEDITAGRALYQEFTNHELRARGFDTPLLSPVEAGRRLAGATRPHDLALFEYFQTDRAGHSQDALWARAEIEKLDLFLGSLLRELSAQAGMGTSDTLVVLTSDHGNIEDLGTRRHTLNPVPLLAWGPGAAWLTATVGRLDALQPALLCLLARRPRDRENDPG